MSKTRFCFPVHVSIPGHSEWRCGQCGDPIEVAEVEAPARFFCANGEVIGLEAEAQDLRVAAYQLRCSRCAQKQS